ncbi:hypothetical protein [Corynebacterium pseudotuberculosis]|uniref:hypothetical protein n=1 Tax=Corynebacterium pseudotuberculosis TaxID=1719 RepID=UPI0007DDF994|nr:Hypothetical protein CpE55_0695 [Corynebacterium pseudotuberculosis]
MSVPGARSSSYLLVAWTAMLITLLMWALWLPSGWFGMLGLRDMVVLNHPALTAGAVGFGDLPARNAPQDGVLALLSHVIPATWIVRVLLITAAVAGAIGAARLGSTSWSRAAAITLTLWNPFVVERLLQGQWSLVVAAWLLPMVITASTPGRIAALWLSSLTPTGAVIATTTGLVAARSKLPVLLAGVVASVPWLIPSLVTVPMSSTTAFLARAETWTGTVGALMGLGGIWNAEAVPPSRSAGFAVFGVVLCVLTFCKAPRRWQLLGLFSVVACLSLSTPAGEWVLTNVPGVSLFRDSQKLIMLLIPALVAGAGRMRWRPLAIVTLFLVILQIPDAPVALKQLAPVAERPWPSSQGDLLFPDSRGLVTYHGRTMVDPRIKAQSSVEAGGLVVDGALVDDLSPRYTAALEEWRRGCTECLRKRGIGAVVTSTSSGEETITEIGGRTHRRRSYWVGVSLVVLWLTVGAGVVGVWAVRSISSRKRRPVSSQE